MSQPRGVYFLANDKVLELAIAFLNSFRSCNPKIPLCLVPFDSNYMHLATLRTKYAFDIFDDDRLLARCDAISSRFHNTAVGQYRKLALWEGKFDEFIYIDVDTVVLENVDFAFEFLASYDFITSHSNMPHLQRWVWKPSIQETGKLAAEQIEYSANTGFIVSRVRAMTLQTIEAKLQSAVSLAAHMELLCTEQPLLNYLIVTSGKHYSSLSAIARESGRRDIPLEVWAGMWFINVRDGRLLRPHNKPPALLVHWAGEWHRRCHEGNPLWRYYRELDPSLMSSSKDQKLEYQTAAKVCEHCGQPIK